MNVASCATTPAANARSGLMPLIWLADDRCSVGADAPRPIDAVGARDRRLGSVHRGWLADDRRPVRPDAAGSVNPIGASGAMALLGEGEGADRKHNGECNLFHPAISR